jgi:hypothetical protein
LKPSSEKLNTQEKAWILAAVHALNRNDQASSFNVNGTNLTNVKLPAAFSPTIGTSYGFRDALALGYSARYTVAVWVGRTDGTPRPGSYGRNTAAPLLFHIFDLLPPEPALPIVAQRNPREPARRVGAALKRFIASADVVSTAANRAAPPSNLSSERRTSRTRPGWFILRTTRPRGEGRCASLPLGRQRLAFGSGAHRGANCLDARWSRFCQDLGDRSRTQVRDRRSVDRVAAAPGDRIKTNRRDAVGLAKL